MPEEHAVIEILRPDKSVYLTGEGPFLITDLDNYAMPIIRYANGDAGKISDHGGCGFPFTRIERLDGRYNSLLMTHKGDLISGRNRDPCFSEFLNSAELSDYPAGTPRAELSHKYCSVRATSVRGMRA